MKQDKRPLRNKKPASRLYRRWIHLHRGVSCALILTLTWMAAEPWNLVHASPAIPSTAPRELGPERRLGELLEDLHRELTPEAQAQDGHGRRLRLNRLEKELREVDRAIRAGLKEDAAWIDDHGLPRKIAERQRAATSHYREQSDALFRDLDAWLLPDDGAATALKKTQRVAREALAGRLEAALPARRPATFDREQLPFGTPAPVEAEPRIEKAAFNRGLLPLKSSTLPEPADLEPTVDAQITPEIQALAATLGNDPIALFEHVRDRLGFTPTWGSIQGSAACLASRECNATDTSSLLIALLRAAGIPARYVVGTVDIPIALALDWLGGFTDPQSAADFMASSGTPTTAVGNDLGEIVAIRVEHVWVEAFLDYIPSRGARRAEAQTWVPLDAAVKRFDRSAGLDLAPVLGFDSQSTLSQLEASAIVAQDGLSVSGFDNAFVEQQALDLLALGETHLDTNLPVAALPDLVTVANTNSLGLEVLPASLPYRVLTTGFQAAELPASLRHSLRIEVSSRPAAPAGLTFEASLPELARSKITLSFSTATAADEQALLALLPDDSADPDDLDLLPSELPAFLLNVVPDLVIDGVVVATGDPVGLGEIGRLRLALSQPGSAPRVVDNDLIAGTYSALVLGLAPAEDLSERATSNIALATQIDLGNFDGATKDDIIGEFLFSAGKEYWAEQELIRRFAAHNAGMVTARLPSLGLFVYDLTVTRLLGAPQTVEGGLLSTDIDLNILAASALDGDALSEVAYKTTTGMLASRFEAVVWEQALSESITGQGVSTVDYLAFATTQDVPIFQITTDNLNDAIAQLQVPATVLTEIRNAVGAGLQVTIPQRLMLKDRILGTGLLALDPATGNGAYQLHTGQSGGGLSVEAIPDGPLEEISKAILPGLVKIAPLSKNSFLKIGGTIFKSVNFLFKLHETFQKIPFNPEVPLEQRAALLTLIVMSVISTAVLKFGLLQNGIFGPVNLVALLVMWHYINRIVTIILSVPRPNQAAQSGGA